jgi:hypothetical protein
MFGKLMMSEDKSKKSMPEGKANQIVEAHGRVTSTVNRRVVGSSPTLSARRDSSDGRAARTFPTFSSTTIFPGVSRGEALERATSPKSIRAVWPKCLPHSFSDFSSLYRIKDSSGEASGRVSSPLTAPIGKRALRQVRVLQLTFLTISSPVPFKGGYTDEFR